MTTPERLRRRQRLEGTALLLVGLLFATYAYINEERADAQRDCLQDQVQALTQVIEDRGSVNSRNNALIDGFILTVVDSVATEDEQKFAKAIKDYPEKRAALEREREKAKVPPFPTGKCDS